MHDLLPEAQSLLFQNGRVLRRLAHLSLHMKCVCAQLYSLGSVSASSVLSGGLPRQRVSVTWCRATHNPSGSTSEPSAFAAFPYDPPPVPVPYRPQFASYIGKMLNLRFMMTFFSSAMSSCAAAETRDRGLGSSQWKTVARKSAIRDGAGRAGWLGAGSFPSSRAGRPPHRHRTPFAPRTVPQSPA